METGRLQQWRKIPAAGTLVLLLAAAAVFAEQPSPAATNGFDDYVGRVEARLALQHSSPDAYLAPVNWSRVRSGDLVIEQLTPDEGAELPGALIHHWRGTAFVPGARGADFVRLLKNLPAYPRVYAPEVLRASSIVLTGDRIQSTLRIKQQHILTVVVDTAYDIGFAQLDAEHGSSILRSTRVTEIDSPGTRRERALSPSEQHGFLWRMNLYWSYEERDGGLYLQIESVSLSRSIPAGFGWLIGPFVKSVPRESLEFTLRATRDALRQ